MTRPALCLTGYLIAAIVVALTVFYGWLVSQWILAFLPLHPLDALLIGTGLVIGAQFIITGALEGRYRRER